jgi:hypothetical protein
MHGRPLTKGKRMYVIQIEEMRGMFSLNEPPVKEWLNYKGLSHIEERDADLAILTCKDELYSFTNRYRNLRLVNKIDGEPDVVIWEAS